MAGVLVIQSFGRETEYKRAILTILSYYAYSGHSRTVFKVLLFTDRPDYFVAPLQGLPVEYIELTSEKIAFMRGKINFLHRMKVALIDEAFKRVRANLLYVDSDTFFIGDPEPYMNRLSEKVSFMHLWEYNFESLRDLPLPAGKSFRAFLNLIESKSFNLANGEFFRVTPQDASWNAGVMMFHQSHERFMPDVYALTDQFYPDSQNHASEQYAFSLVLQKHTQLSSCDSVVYHYWYSVKKQIIDKFLAREMNSAWMSLSLEEKVDVVRRWTRLLPSYFERHILTKQDNAIQAFNRDNFLEGYKWAVKAVVEQPLNLNFIKDTFYHITRHIKLK